jgi:two-component SAPR family response regulator
MCIYDDDIEFSLLFEKLLYRYAEENDKEIDVEIFQGGENAALQIAQNEYDILFLDIDLGDVKGFEIGKQIRDELKNNKIQIVYISGDTDFQAEKFLYILSGTQTQSLPYILHKLMIRHNPLPHFY